jgi:DedD protein
MNTLFEREDRLYEREDRDREERQDRQDSEITLNTGTLLAIFFGLVVVCGVFFGFGYSMGRHSSDVKAAAAQAAATSAKQEATAPSLPKPSALEVMPPPTEEASAPEDDSAQRTVVVDQPYPTANSEPPVKVLPVSSPSVKTVAAPILQRQPTAVAPKPAPKVAATVPPASTPRSSLATFAQPVNPAKATAPTPTMVQIAAISHPEDAEALVAALKKRGYRIIVRNEPQDKLLHVQVGPFGDRADALAMRQKLLSDGYNAIIK